MRLAVAHDRGASWSRLRAAGVVAALFIAAAAAHAQGVGLAPPAGAPGGVDQLAAQPTVTPRWGELPEAQPPLPGLMPFAAADSGTPVPYNKDEFPGWLRDIRRAEVITIGAFPITLLFSSLGYQLYRSITGVTVPITQQEQIGVLLGGVGLAATVALLDFILGKIQPPPKPQEAP